MKKTCWRKVADELPPELLDVLVCERHSPSGALKVTTIASYGLHNSWDKRKEWRVRANCSGYECDDDLCEPKYWMPLPEPPNDQTHLRGQVAQQENP